ncbi:MAG: Replication factor C large subunit [Candidatus Thorarchaeota archaeon AB_25]|nr:MAG: Replication factor C large subunit [Candidatus Thorarchaeota archaeon AB_25]
MSNESLPWPEKHRPRKLDGLVGNHETIRTLKSWVESWISRIPSKRAALLVGPPGTGKTASVGALANDLDMELVEFNSSDKRNKDSIETLVWRAASQQTLDGRPRLILLDEVDGLSGTSDRGGVGAILKVIKDAVHPIVMTANDPNSPRLKDLMKVCQVFNFGLIESDDIEKILKRILSENNVDVSSEALDEIIEGSRGDLRAAISDLEFQVRSGLTSSMIEPAFRDSKRGTEETLRHLFASAESKMARRALSESELNHDSLVLWLEENLHLHLMTPKELDEGFEQLSLADITLGRIMRDQNWKLLAYVYDYLSIGVAMSRSETPFRRVKYSQPTWPLLVWQGNRKRDKQSEILASLSMVTGVSKRRVRQTHLDAIGEIVKINPKILIDFATWLNVEKSTLVQKRSR